MLNEMNRFETSEWVYLYGIGAWHVEQNEQILGLCHTTFLPAVMQRPGVAHNFFLQAPRRVAAVKQRFELKEPESLPDDVNVSIDDIVELMKLLEKRGTQS